MLSFGEPVEKEFYDDDNVDGTTYYADTDGFVYAYVQQTDSNDYATKVSLFGFAYAGSLHELTQLDLCRAHDESSTDFVLATILMPVRKSEHWTVILREGGAVLKENAKESVNALAQSIPSGVYWIPMTAAESDSE
jgi:hypothetical protein